MSILNHLSRRQFISVAGLAPAASMLPGILPEMNRLRNGPSGAGIKLPCPELFSVRDTYLNAAYTHPISNESAHAIREYIDYRMMNGNSGAGFRTGWDEVKNMYAGLINAEPDEIAWIPSTMAGENFIVKALGIPGSGDKIVTDAYHFDGSLYMYSQLAKQGAVVHTVVPENNRIDINRMASAITAGTKLVAISLVSMVNGFQHDLKTLCEIAHSRGAMVYADIIQAVGAVPVDVHDCRVDFCAASSFKWLMGDFGAGFLYVSKESMHHLKRSQFGYRQVTETTSHILPFDTPGDEPFTFKTGSNAACFFEVGSLGNEAVIALSRSLKLISEIGPDAIQAHRQPMLKLLHSGLAGTGFIPLTPEDSTSPIVSFAYRDAGKKLSGKLADAGIRIQLYDNRFRISPSVYNSTNDIEKLIEVLTKN
jgi:selenocysteine lyase/cysteine desulfurase